VKNKGAYGVDQRQTKKIGASLLAASLLAAIWQVSPQRDQNRSDGATPNTAYSKPLSLKSTNFSQCTLRINVT